MLEGCITALVTPFRGGKVDQDAVRRLLDTQVAGGVSGVVVCGTTGESPTLDGAERRALLRTVVQHLAGAVPVWMGTGSYSTADAVRRTVEAEEDGATGALVVTPYYNRPGPEGLRAHFRAVADSSSLPVMLYDIPSRTGCRIGPELCLELSRHERIVAVKDAVGVLPDTMSMVAGGLPVLAGDDVHVLPWIAVGAQGVVSVAGNVVPDEISALVREARAGDLEAARARHYRLLPLMRALFLESNPTPVKALLAHLGVCTAEVRLPLVEVSASTRQAVASAHRSATQGAVGTAGG